MQSDRHELTFISEAYQHTFREGILFNQMMGIIKRIVFLLLSPCHQSHQRLVLLPWKNLIKTNRRCLGGLVG